MSQTLFALIRNLFAAKAAQPVAGVSLLSASALRHVVGGTDAPLPRRDW